MLIFSKLRQQGHVTNVDAGFDERLRRLQAVGHRRDLYQQISGVVILQRTCHRDRLIDTGTASVQSGSTDSQRPTVWRKHV